MRDTKVGVGRSYGMGSDSGHGHGRRGSESVVPDGSAGPEQLSEMLEYRKLLEKTVASLKRQLLEIENSKNTAALEKQIPAIPPFRRKFTRVETKSDSKEEKSTDAKENLSQEVDELSRRLAVTFCFTHCPRHYNTVFSETEFHTKWNGGVQN
eukprot:TRINITY_DN6671_c0_g1_i1.p1 TRINITY_DN6671_c0_g1~~TRINITY_DN6671_c0_g1_i1.p1  ORF type:complete len:153 (-),score=11.75 TRINITY_DN6671_c0_g1_i1:40-498(-)